MITSTLRRCCRRATTTSAAAKQSNIGSCRYISAQQLDSDRQCRQSPLLTNNNELSAIVNSFPTDGVDYAFGYGSGVLKQQQSLLSDDAHSTKPGMVDIILAVDDTYSWHKRNLQSNTNHYSGFARIGGSSFVYWMQNLGARLYFHPFVTVDLSLSNDNKHQRTTTQREIKYGVISTDDMIEDLTQWKYLYLAGRMHKPTVEIENRKHEIIAKAQHQNLLAAVSASILLHGGVDDDDDDSLPTTQLYNTIAGISYAGDIRMQTGAEDPNKVKKLVETPGMLGLWDNMYSTIFEDLQRLGILSMNNTKLDLDFNDIGMRRELMKNLPQRLHSDKIVGISHSIDSIIQGNELLRNELRRIVAPAAKSQSIKGLFSAGVSKSFNYAMAKFAKGRLKS
ncbi:hypothetical protein ACHAWC_009102 [Mediolabrus comicus]